MCVSVTTEDNFIAKCQEVLNLMNGAEETQFYFGLFSRGSPDLTSQGNHNTPYM